MDQDLNAKLLAEANVARMRGEHHRAQDLLRQVLDASPDDPDATLMLGEVFADQGDLEKALPYLDQAAVLRPHSRPLIEKRDELKRRIADRDVASVVAQLGLPTTKSRAKLWAMMSAAVVFGFALLSFFLGRAMDRGQKEVSAPIDIQPIKTAQVTEPEVTEPDAPVVPTKRDSGITIIDFRPDDDKQLLSSLKSQVPEPDNLTEARRDNRTGNISLTLRQLAGADNKTVAATYAATVLRAMKDCPGVSVRVEVASKLVYEADLTRAALEGATEPNTPPAQLLSNEWMSQS